MSRLLPEEYLVRECRYILSARAFPVTFALAHILFQESIYYSANFRRAGGGFAGGYIDGILVRVGYGALGMWRERGADPVVWSAAEWNAHYNQSDYIPAATGLVDSEGNNFVPFEYSVLVDYPGFGSLRNRVATSTAAAAAAAGWTAYDPDNPSFEQIPALPVVPQIQFAETGMIELPSIVYVPGAEVSLGSFSYDKRVALNFDVDCRAFSYKDATALANALVEGFNESSREDRVYMRARHEGSPAEPVPAAGGDPIAVRSFSIQIAY